MSNLFPQVDPIPVVQINTPYTGKLVWLSFAPNLSDPKTLDASAHIRTLPYRVLEDGTIDQAPESMAVNLSFGKLSEAAAKDPKLAAAVGAIAKAIKDFMGAK